ncbi:MAG: WXG100 family type VII secretion target [Nocardioides sp.]
MTDLMLNLDHTDLHDVLAELRSTLDDLRETRSRTDREVGHLLDGGWRGRAADGYHAGWLDWQHGSDEVLAALADMADLIEAHHRDVTEVDRDVARVFSR